MKIDKINNPIAGRKFKTSSDEHVLVVLGCPNQFEDGDYFCPYSIEFDDVIKYGYCGGVDAIQAIQLCLDRLSVELESFSEKMAWSFIGWIMRRDIWDYVNSIRLIKILHN